MILLSHCACNKMGIYTGQQFHLVCREESEGACRIVVNHQSFLQGYRCGKLCIINFIFISYFKGEVCLCIGRSLHRIREMFLGQTVYNK